MTYKERCMELYLKYGERDFDYDDSDVDNSWADLYPSGYVRWRKPNDAYDFLMYLTPKALELIKA